MIRFIVNGQSLRRADADRIVGDSRNYLKAKFVFDEDWTEYTPRFASFYRTDKTDEPLEIEIVDDECTVPWEVLDGSGELEISVSGGNLLTTNPVTIEIYKAGKMFVLKPTDVTDGAYVLLVKQLLELEGQLGEVEENVTTEINKETEEIKADIAETKENMSITEEEYAAIVSEVGL